MLHNFADVLISNLLNFKNNKIFVNFCKLKTAIAVNLLTTLLLIRQKIAVCFTSKLPDTVDDVFCNIAQLVLHT